MRSKIKDFLLRHTFTRRAGIIIKAFFRGDVKNGIIVAKNSVYRVNYAPYNIYCDYYISPETRSMQENYKFDKNIKFSVIVPLYNTPKIFLTQMIDSVLNQTYKNLELVMADGSDAKNSDVKRICKAYAKKDNRIVYKRLNENKGISGNTNECLKMATGDYISLFDHDDLLHPSALFEVMKAICETGADFIYTDEATFTEEPSDAHFVNYKPDFNPDYLRSLNYICHLSTVKKSLLDKVGYFNSEFDGSQDYDLILRITEQAEKIAHIPRVLYYWRAHKNSTASDIAAKPYIMDAAIGALNAHLNRLGLKGTVMNADMPSTYKIKYDIIGNPKISIIIPNMDHVSTLKTCLESLLKLTYKNIEVIIVENNSKEEKTFSFYEKAKAKYKSLNIKVVTFNSNGEFNYSKINNFGFTFATGEYILLLNNDIEIISKDILEQMLMFNQRADVGAVGAKLYYPDDTIQHAGVIIGLGGVAGHSHKGLHRSDFGFVGRTVLAQDLSAVTAACMMIKSSVFKEVGGLDEEAFKVAFNDVDLCMRICKAGYRIVFNPDAEAYHYESKSRGYEDTPEKVARFAGEIERFKSRWEKELALGDPNYNKNLTLNREDFTPAP